jgi:hypothetical protein
MRKQRHDRNLHGFSAKRRLPDEGHRRMERFEPGWTEHPPTRIENRVEVLSNSPEERGLTDEGLGAETLRGKDVEQSAVNRLRLLRYML